MNYVEGFESAQYLASWAGVELDNLDRSVADFIKKNPATMAEDFDAKRGQYSLKLVLPPPPVHFRGIASNIVKNLRDALDQAVNAAAHQVCGKHRRRSHFPFGENPGDLDIAMTKNQCADIPEELYATLRTYEPYPTGDGYAGGDNLLRLLGRISGSHKHRVTLVTTFVPGQVQLTDFSINGGSTGAVFEFDPTAEPPKNHEFVLVRYGPGGYASMKAQITRHVAFAHPDLRKIPAIDFLAHCQRAVLHITQDLQAQAAQIPTRT